ncbi:MULTISPECIES: hypothetical protein [Olivibacter]|uniref:Amphi-Trp domain-containing protein n=1 Tax=Olivibacter jilunii TaxID=985016 RepID=A0ABW6AWG4_9SPHI
MTEEELTSLFDALKKKAIAAHKQGISVTFESNVFVEHEEDVPNPNAKVIGESLLFRIGDTPKDVSK